MFTTYLFNIFSFKKRIKISAQEHIRMENCILTTIYLSLPMLDQVRSKYYKNIRYLSHGTWVDGCHVATTVCRCAVDRCGVSVCDCGGGCDCGSGGDDGSARAFGAPSTCRRRWPPEHCSSRLEPRRRIPPDPGPTVPTGIARRARTTGRIIPWRVVVAVAV